MQMLAHRGPLAKPGQSHRPYYRQGLIVFPWFDNLFLPCCVSFSALGCSYLLAFPFLCSDGSQRGNSATAARQAAKGKRAKGSSRTRKGMGRQRTTWLAGEEAWTPWEGFRSSEETI